MSAVNSVTITIQTTNDSFGRHPEFEVGRILNRYLSTVPDLGLRDAPLLDLNGNRVGAVMLHHADR